MECYWWILLSIALVIVALVLVYRGRKGAQKTTKFYKPDPFTPSNMRISALGEELESDSDSDSDFEPNEESLG